MSKITKVGIDKVVFDELKLEKNGIKPPRHPPSVKIDQKIAIDLPFSDSKGYDINIAPIVKCCFTLGRP